MSITQQITALDGVTAPNAATQDQDEFDTNATDFVTALPTLATQMTTLGTQMNELAAGMNALMAGTAISIPYTFSTTTADADPGAGTLRLNNATQNLSTTIRADLAGADASDVTAFLDLMDDSTSAIKGFLMLRGVSDASKFLLFSVSALASPSGYRNITVAVVASSAASPFSNGDSVVLEFTRNGDKGDTGAAGTVGLTLLATASPSAVATVDFTSGIDSTYEEYELHLINVIPATNSVKLLARTSANAGSSWDSAAANYDWTVGATTNGSGTPSTGQGSSTGDTSMQISASSSISNTAANGGISGVIRIVDPSATASNKTLQCVFTETPTGATGASVTQAVGRRLSTAAINGIRLLFSSGNIASGKLKLYGVRKT